MASSGEDDGEHSLYALLPDNDDRYERLEIQDALRSAMKDLSETERAVLKFRYVDELSQSETARRLGVSQMFVSRMERKLLARLKKTLKIPCEAAKRARTIRRAKHVHGSEKFRSVEGGDEGALRFPRRKRRARRQRVRQQAGRQRAGQQRVAAFRQGSFAGKRNPRRVYRAEGTFFGAFCPPEESRCSEVYAEAAAGCLLWITYARSVRFTEDGGIKVLIKISGRASLPDED
ncbi:MAG: sigma-70 family RNA polymerase sigma factor [Christensenellaceae bacterium]